MTNKNLAIYIHWPFCLSKCPYCDFNSHVREAVDYDKWEIGYKRAIDLFIEKIAGKQISSIFFGGGTPSLMPPKLVGTVLDHLNKISKIAPNVEITLEANPTSVEISKLNSFKLMGVNRVSMGIQSLRDDQLKFLGREHSSIQALRALNQVSKIFDNYSFDLIYALPNQTPSAWREELTAALEFAGKHISLYQLTIEKGTKFHSDFIKGKFMLPNEDLSCELYYIARELTKEKKLHEYEISNYAQTGFESVHNMNYWLYNDYIGIGPGAHSRVDKTAIMMIHHPENWLEAVLGGKNPAQEILSLNNQQILYEFLLMGLRLDQGIRKQAFVDIFQKEFHEMINYKNYSLLKDQNIIIENQNSFKVHQDQKLLLNNIIEKLL